MKLPGFVSDDISKKPEPFIPGPLSMRRKRVKLRVAKHVKQRREYKRNKPKKERIRCEQCNKRFVPKRITKQFRTSNCAKAHHRMEWKIFRGLGFVDRWDALSDESKEQHHKLTWMRSEYRKWIFGA